MLKVIQMLLPQLIQFLVANIDIVDMLSYEAQEIQNDLDRVLQLIKPLAVIIVGLLMIWIVSATLLPFYAKIPQLLSSTHG